MSKSALRKKYKALRNQLTDQQLDDFSIAIANQLLKLPVWQARYYHLFLTIAEQKEVDTEFILNILSGKDKDIILSKSNFDDYSLTHFLLTDNTAIKKNAYNIPEPIDGIEVPSNKIDVVFVPLLAYNTKGNRIGYGKGFYDRFLADCKPDVIKIGLSFFPPEETDFTVSENDISLDFCVTPERVFEF
ncbi:5-formyltetrahydrofolate cyclo-ligase [Kordia sp. YSTF-M3]|uniref:5-formyltetrahydrofolate cyclo-ligase n=1 Tax=Kordia aestuariivivens TaxID=2759037 RepID=A0ABR7Q9F7_9FLAO|nr:5-formyltetrahydrofolate cyclo-ligase [Kordia aestuariivivens]MBC8755190.1 5-formyltetrahydrofolate cyclo-ligase [Kordia aestuariivivens]